MRKQAIQFDNFSFTYRSQAKPTLYDINLTIYEGDKVLIAGPSGSGKSTLAHCMNGLIPWSYKGTVSGSLKVMGEETRDLGIFALSKRIGTVLQDSDGQFIGLTVGEDIAFAQENDCVPQQEMFDSVSEAARMVDMGDFLASAPHQLSGGQKQRVALAGIIVDQVDILLFDEPLANLDPATGRRAIELIDRIHKETGKTIVIIEHRLEEALYCGADRIVVVDEGRIAADMHPDELLATPILEQCHIREPLYVKAVRHAGVEVTPDLRAARIDTLNISDCKDGLVRWFEAAVPPERIPAAEPILQLDGLCFGYTPDRLAVDDVSLTIGRGEMMSIVGKNGAGKSTLSKLICGFEKPASGVIRFASEDITRDTIKERSFRIGMVMQNPNHMISKHMIYDEVALGLVVRGIPKVEIAERVEKALRICGLYPYRKWPISALSYGQKKRVTIASILVLEPDILILDEPTAGQDLRHYTEMMEFIAELNRGGTTILLITHDMHLMLEYTSRAIVMAGGRIIADDHPSGVLADRDVTLQANLKTTSLFELAERAGIVDPDQFVRRFIAYDKEARAAWQSKFFPTLNENLPSIV